MLRDYYARFPGKKPFHYFHHLANNAFSKYKRQEMKKPEQVEVT
jgi:hypothetical protein